MTRSIVFSRDGVILNACCLRNIYASGCMVAILGALPIPTMMARIAYQEQPLRILREIKEGEGLVVELIDLQPILNTGLLAMVSLTSEAEEAKMVDLAAVLKEDGEATTAALALLRKSRKKRRNPKPNMNENPHDDRMPEPNSMRHRHEWQPISRAWLDDDGP